MHLAHRSFVKCCCDMLMQPIGYRVAYKFGTIFVLFKFMTDLSKYFTVRIRRKLICHNTVIKNPTTP